jgi:hypothetical protein
MTEPQHQSAEHDRHQTGGRSDPGDQSSDRDAGDAAGAPAGNSAAHPAGPQQAQQNVEDENPA